ncbi:MAG: FHA domain-containing protein, partial [Clostridia bacterium]|nr:FHA domain-containing protein [Deltaproteobacteria bacterium]
MLAMARKSKTDPNAPIPGERRGLRGGASDTLQNQANVDDESTRPEEPRQLHEMVGDTTQAEPGMFDVPTRGGGMKFDVTPIEPIEVGDDEIFEPSKVVPVPDSDTAEADEPFEHTTIDAGLLDKLKTTADFGDKTKALTPAKAFEEVPTTLGNTDKSKSDSKSQSLKAPRPPGSERRPTAIEDVASVTANLSVQSRVASFERIASGSVNASNPNDKPGSTMILEGADHRKALEAAAAARAAKFAPIPEPIPVPTEDGQSERPSEQPTSARPLSPASYSGDAAREKFAGSDTGDFAKDDDGWSDYQESADDWGRSDSHSSGSKQKSNNTSRDGHAPERRNDSGVFAKLERSEVKVVVKLLALEGEDTGEIDIATEDVTFGREADCPIVLKDPSVSRRHARLTRVENGWELIDLKSGNGTFVNDKRVERAIVRHNDEIKLGSALFRFVDPSEGMRPVDASAAPILAASSRVALFGRMREKPRLRTVVVVIGVLSAVLLLCLSVLAIQRNGSGKVNTEVFQLYLQGVEQFKQHRWVPAEGFFAAALQRDHEHQRSRRYLEAIAVEKRADQALAAAQLRLGVGDLAGAYDNAIQASDSVFFGA